MYQLLKHPTDNTLKVVSILNNEYPDYLSAGYETVFEGTQKQCNEVLEQTNEENLIIKD